MKTYFEIVEGKTYRSLTAEEKEAVQNRQTALVIAWQDETNEMKRREVEDELMASFAGLIKGMAKKYADNSFSVDAEEFEGIISLALAETMIKFDRTLNKPFQPVLIQQIRYAILGMYREKGYDLHDKADRLDKRVSVSSEYHSDTEVNLSTTGELTSMSSNPIDETFVNVVTDEVLSQLFDDNELKKTIVHMFLQGFKRNEIVSAINTDKKPSETVAKQVNRVVKSFKDNYITLMQADLA